MNFFIRFFYIILYQPLLNALILLYLFVPGRDFGVAVILLTFLIKVALFPISKKSIQSQQVLQGLQPKMKEIQNKFKENREQQAKAVMGLYKQEKISPASGCLPLLLQLPILIALYQVFLNVFKPDTLKNVLYGFVPQPGVIDPNFLGIINLAAPFMQKAEGITTYYWPVLLLAVITGIVQFLQMKLLNKTSVAPDKQKQKGKGPDFSKMMQTQMTYLLPALIVFIVVQFGSIIGLYILFSSLFTMGEQYIIKLKVKS